MSERAGQVRGGHVRAGQDRGGQDRGGQDRGGQDRGGQDHADPIRAGAARGAVEAAILPLRGERTTRAFAPDPHEAASLVLDLRGSGLGGRWVEISFRDEGRGSFSRVELAAVAERLSQHETTSLAERAYGNGRFTWTGRLPAGLVALKVTPMLGETEVTLGDMTLRERSRLALLGRGLLRRPDLAGQAVFWRLLGKRVRARNRLLRAITPPGLTGYDTWVRCFDTLSEADRARIRAEAGAMTDPPLISVVMPVYNPAPKVLEDALRSVRAQLYPHWELCIADDASTDPAVPRLLDRAAAADARVRVVRRPENGHIARATNTALALAAGPYVAFMDHDDVLPEHALFEVARAIAKDPSLDLIYTDEDKVDAKGRRFEPHFKSDWNPELLYAQNYINHLTVVRTSLVREVGGLRPGFEGSQDHDLLLRLADRLSPDRIRHLPHVLYHWRAAIGSGTFSDTALARAEAARLQALRDLIARRGWPHRAERGPLGFNRLVRAVPDPAPRVSVVIPTRDRAELLAVALRGLLKGTAYPDIEVIILDNDSREPATRALFAEVAADPRVRVLPSPGAFNFSALSNEGAAAATGPLLLFLNNDIEVREPGWLAEMVSIAVEPGIGAVGAKLSYPDGTLQHGGVVLGAGGVAGHSHLGIGPEDPGYFGRMAMAQEVSAVTGACLMMRASVFREVGGFDAERLAVAFNDVDLCLRIRQAGYAIIWTPHAGLIHHESKSRGLEDTPQKRARFEAEVATMLERWGAQLRNDPYYNPNFARAKAQFRLW
ncbi:glycosyl transferase family 2 [Methylobacterium sp. 4-46]|uniref:glycosyltransferase family 2 protein n=1 Tax=unclassified Methylobacterium TaxID=2615210 RepID=UPI000152C696|nr:MULTISPECIES: glycosyltransferase family 2 protein [Methylobacterium]ACA14886.1 glycosyl transferase family 2 [Methylobacterium sp. 4-46]WFT80626.1 glycosyltransferase family 2 protein [Methylobacterium nodulans]